MAPKPSAQRRARSPQQGRIDNYLFDDVDPFATPEPETQSSKPKDGQGLGIEEEVTVAKRARVPRVKLDETRYAFGQYAAAFTRQISDSHVGYCQKPEYRS